MHHAAQRNIARERIITAEVMKLERRQAKQRARNQRDERVRPMSTHVVNSPEALIVRGRLVPEGSNGR